MQPIALTTTDGSTIKHVNISSLPSDWPVEEESRQFAPGTGFAFTVGDTVYTVAPGETMVVSPAITEIYG